MNRWVCRADAETVEDRTPDWLVEGVVAQKGALDRASEVRPVFWWGVLPAAVAVSVFPDDSLGAVAEWAELR
jgi:hypothetical protein